MAAKKTGISRDLVIHPGETIANVLEERGITQAELAAQTGVSPAYVSNVIAGKKDISAKFAFALEYALGVPKSFWLNLQANYDAEMLELNEGQTITDEEREAREALTDVVKYLRNEGELPANERKDRSILSLRKALKISNLTNLKGVVPTGEYEVSDSAENPYILGAWIRMCRTSPDDGCVKADFDKEKTDDLVNELKSITHDDDTDISKKIREVMGRYGIDFSVVKAFKGVSARGYIYLKKDGAYRLALSAQKPYTDKFWFSLLHEIGHIVNGDIGKMGGFIDDGRDARKEETADIFAAKKLLDFKTV